MIPRYVLGTWITDLNYEYLDNSEVVRAYKYTDDSVRSLVTKFRTHGIPLDILVLDFGWHRLGWKGSYDWSPVFPDPKGFLDWARTSGVKTSLNDHPGYAKESTLSDDDSHSATIRSLLGLSNPHVATFTQDISQGWKFRTDSSDSGLSLHWEATTFDDRSWTTLNAGTAWEEQGYEGYDGVAWYRKTILVPSTPRVDSLFLVFSGVDDEYDLFLDGKKVAHYGSQGNSVWNSVTYTNIQSHIRQGSAVQIALRVKDWGGGGGVGVASLSDVPPGQGIRFNLALKNHADAFMNVLHNPLIDLGVDLWWVDGGITGTRRSLLATPMRNGKCWLTRCRTQRKVETS